MTSFAISDSSADDVAVVAVRGEIDVATAPVLARRLGKALRVPRPLIVVDLGETLFIDATGLAVLLSTLRRVTRCSGRLAIACANPTVLRLFEVTKTAASFAIFPGRDGAVAYASEREDVVVALPTGRARRAREAERRGRTSAGTRPHGA
jgi:anti-sigma B factor antagonist